MASEAGRGAQVRLDGEERRYARGGTTLRLIDNIRSKLELEDGGTVANGNSADGSAGNGTAAEDEVLLPGGDVTLVSFDPPGVGSVTRLIQAKLADLPASAADYSTADGLQRGAANIEYVGYSYNWQHRGPNGEISFEMRASPGGVEHWCVVPGVQYAGATLAVIAEQDDADGNLMSKGVGGTYFGNGAGLLAAVQDNGSGNRVANYAALRPGDPGQAPGLYAQSWAGETSVDLALVPLAGGALQAGTGDGTVTGGASRGANAVDLQISRTSASAVASGNLSGVLSGVDNTASGQSAVVAGGQLNTADNIYTWCPGGLRAGTRGIYGKGVWASGLIASPGDAQAGESILRGLSTAGAAVRLTASGGAASPTNVCNLPNFSVLNGSLRVQAVETSTGNSAVWVYSRAAIGRAANAASTVVSLSAVDFANVIGTVAASGDLSVTADLSQGGLNVTFTPPNANTWHVSARYSTGEVS